MRVLISVVTATCVLATSLFVVAQDPPAAKPATTKARLLINGLHCPPCTRTVQNSLSKVPGVKSSSIDWTTKNATVEFDESVLSVQALTQKIAGTPHMMGGGMQYSGWLALKVPALKDKASGEKAKAALVDVAGIKQVTVYPDKQAIAVLFARDGKLTTKDVIDALAKADLEATGY